jgi:hypothetical protein
MREISRQLAAAEQYYVYMIISCLLLLFLILGVCYAIMNNIN